MSRRDQLDELFVRLQTLLAPGGEPAETDAGLSGLRAWQAERLARTYADLRKDPQYAAAIEFFLRDLYGPQDFSQRDRDLARAWRHLRRALPRVALEILARAIELQVLTAELDLAMAGVLAPGPVSAAGYAAAYRAVGRRTARCRQIELIVGIGTDLRSIVRHAWLGRLLRAAHGPAHAAGFGALQDFLERGFAAFRAMSDTERFLQAIRDREMQFLNEMMPGTERPDAAAIAPQQRTHA